MPFPLLWPALVGTGFGLADLRAQQSLDGGDDGGNQVGADNGKAPERNPEDPTVSDQGPFTTFPVTTWQGYRPTRSQEYRPENHHGVDLMFARRGGGGEPGDMWPPQSINGTKNFFMADGVYAVAVADATIWATGMGPTGLYVVLDHGKPFASFYVHLGSLIVPNGIQRGILSATGMPVKVQAGDALGIISFSPQDQQKLKHLHFELWKDGGAESHVDPWPYIEHLDPVDLPNHTQPIGDSQGR